MKTILLLLAAAFSALAAEPDWNRLDAHALEFLQSYVRIPSITPPSDTRAAAKLFASELERAGMHPQLYSSGPAGQTNLVVRLEGRDRTRKPLLLLNHFDVVPVDAKAWKTDPFGAEVRDGNIWGRGTLDMKGIGVQQLMSLIALKESGKTPSRDIVLLSTADEELGGIYGINWMIKNHWHDIDAEYVLDEGGMGSRDALAPNRLLFGISVGDKVVCWLRLHARGTAGHGSQPIPDNANVTLLHAIEKALVIPDSAKENPVVTRMKVAAGGTLAPNKFTSAIQRDTCSLTTLTSGVGSPPKVNVIPSSAEATLDCRLLPDTNADEFVSEVRARVNDPRVTVEVMHLAPNVKMSRTDTELFRILTDAVLHEHPGATVMPMLVPFGTDSAYLQQRGVTAYGFTPMVLDAATAATMHSDSERIPVEEFRKGLRIFYDVLSHW